ncbi:NAD-dependent epimerase/dehydratase family protein [Haliangium sp.]|uniref:NAD-dependent epimerase/dehydratase family protein n=1 Tax=Haliangium sp. TaxID=2663208 RepID=UPI003D0A8074
MSTSGPILITGGTGFLGEHVVRCLLDRGREVFSDIRVLARSRASALEQLAREHDQLRLVRGDLLTGDALGEALDGCAAVLHLAGLVSREPTDGQRMMRVHVDGTRRLLEHMHTAGVGRVVIASTSGTVAVSEYEEILDEEAGYATEIVAGWPYYASKVYQEKLAFSLGEDLGIEVVAVNPSLLLGPGDRRISSTLDVLRFLRREIPVAVEGGISFVDVRDAAEATVAALERGRAGERYLLGGPNWTVSEFFGRLSRVAKVPAPRVKVPARAAQAARFGASVLEHVYRKVWGKEPPVDRISVEMGQHYWWLDPSKAERELGFEARDPGLTLADTVAYLRQDLGLDD